MVNKFTLQLKNPDGSVEKESQLILNEGDTLIMKYSKEISLRDASEVFDRIKKSMKLNSNLIAIPSSIELQVLSKA